MLPYRELDDAVGLSEIAGGFLYAIRLPKNQVLQESIGHLLTRPVGRPRPEFPSRGRLIHDPLGSGLIKFLDRQPITGA